MARKGKVFKLNGMVTAKRQSKKNINNSDLGISKPAIKRLARRGGVKRISSLIS
jgi:histone H4